MHTPCSNDWMRADPLRGQVEVGWALEIDIFLVPVKWHRAVRQVPFGTQKAEIFRAQPTPSHLPK
jgi:hypothetical protein